ncbi:sigma-70 family RNA polymerase sigma factor [Clostridioides sp. ES-S-0005-03]|uniref:RNA polymerase sigma factor n=1 Tax=unclassified Clostridioides TaxID=2635829 RepID=UPI001D0C45BF|nr:MULTISPECIES: sigma-70 family RNA polymerase sigma factor [unclassified Clostridioides]MCC0654869.1 sigma-70 family RNA polymerase sigma factor [Clostridioides sp. ES-S-0001-03]MCC0682770.1 sigma-70 family RNA polymerase sigma factor [Clostridioides sp. ES-S-0005-03]MCC0697729.1 sigma-70 family RNA polymerase sigma factor [Clostridioides sp. ES-S-0048-02]MCC0785133.1 sigma-70 family RNA polymerase sigma factor [Clostridioides sp. ES-S-0108-01]UDN49644.1 sigma-70 family RNA polymerase sigma 
MLLYLTIINSEEERNKFEDIYIKYKKLMFYVANQILKDEALSEDAVHNAFLKIIDNLDKINDVNSPKTKGFVVIIVKRISINIYNKRKREEINDINDESYKFNSLDLSIEKLGNYSHLGDALKKLSETDLQVILLKYSHGFSTKEISKILNIKEVNLYKKNKRALEKLKKILIEMEALSNE